MSVGVTARAGTVLSLLRSLSSTAFSSLNTSLGRFSGSGWGRRDWPRAPVPATFGAAALPAAVLAAGGSRCRLLAWPPPTAFFAGGSRLCERRPGGKSARLRHQTIAIAMPERAPISSSGEAT